MSAYVIHVDPESGRDTNTGSTWDSPKRTLYAALGTKRLVHAAPGDYQLDHPLGTADLRACTLIGAGPQNTQLVVTGDFDAINLPGSAVSCMFKAFSIVSFTARTAGAGINLTASDPDRPHYRLRFEDILVQNVGGDGVVADSLHQSRFRDVWCEASKSWWQGNGWTIHRSISVRLNDCTATSIEGAHMGGNACYLGADCDTIGIRGGEFARSTLDCIALRNEDGHTGPRLVRISDTYTEASTSGNGIGIYAGRDIGISLPCTDQNTDGILVAGGESIRILGPWSALNRHNGIYVDPEQGDDPLDPDSPMLVADDTTNNSQERDATYSGVATNPAQPHGAQVIGGVHHDHIGAYQNPTAPRRQAHGLAL